MSLKYLIIWFIVVSFLPNDARLKAPNYPLDVKPIIFVDIDRDKEDEVIATYKLIKENNRIQLLVLKKANKHWRVMEQLSCDGYQIDRIEFKDVDKDGIEEMLLGSREAGNWKNLHVYKLNNKKYTNMYITIYSEFKSLDFE